jgi:hypothetical protein
MWYLFPSTSVTRGCMNPAKRHHYVPEGLIRPWIWSEDVGKVRGYFWNTWRQALHCRDEGPKAFCCRPDLFTVASSTVAPDVIETDFFGIVDTAGIRARDILLERGPRALLDTERSDFIRLLLSLDARRPELVQKYRAYGKTLKTLIDADEDVQALAQKYGINQRPSDWFEDYTGVLYEDEALSVIQTVSESPRIGNILMGCHWSIRHFSPGTSELTLSDRPLIRMGATISNNFLWLLPLSPRSLLCISPRRDVIERFQNTRANEIIHDANENGVLQSDMYVFSRQQHDDRSWLAKRLRERSAEIELRGEILPPSNQPQGTLISDEG